MANSGRCAKDGCGRVKGSWTHQIGSSFYTHDFVEPESISGEPVVYRTGNSSAHRKAGQ